jgi:hypothetical protein
MIPSKETNVPKYNTTFELSLKDMELIETALLQRQADNDDLCPKEVNALLGRLHNQKVFYRPKERVYVSG